MGENLLRVLGDALICFQPTARAFHLAGEGAEKSDERIRLPAGGMRLEDAERALNYKIKSFGITHPGWKQNK